MSSPATKRLSALGSIICIVLFFALYYWASVLYPGGSNTDHQAAGFSWLHNYWCDLSGELAKNGQPNPARPLTLAAMLVLSTGMLLFWFALPALFNSADRHDKLIRWTGAASMSVMLFLFSDFHDLVINVSGLLGCIALGATFFKLYRGGFYGFFAVGVVCLLLSCVNYFIYETGIALFALALLQKITFAIFLGWIAALDQKIYRQIK